MLPKINRIKKKKDFEEIFKKGKILRSNFFIFRLTKNDLGLNRFGFVVSQKVSKKATVRNKARRRLTEAIKAEAKNVKNGTDLVIIALPGIEKKEFSEIKKAVQDGIKCLNQ
jgi:ribonuclease P protein component